MRDDNRRSAPQPTHVHDASIEGSSARDGLGDFARALIATRQNVSPRRLVEPGPDAAQLAQLFEAAAAAPDHDMLLPWRFVIVPTGKRGALGEAFALALADRDPGAMPAELEAARAKAERAPLLMLAIARLAPHEHAIPDAERIVSLGCAIQNMLLTAHALGLGAGLTSGQALRSPRLRKLFGLAAVEQPVCFVNVGTVSKRKPLRGRPPPEAFVSTL